MAWLTDLVGFLPLPSCGRPEALLTTDYNAEAIERMKHHPHAADRAIFLREPDAIIPRSFGKDLRAMRERAPKHFDLAGYVLVEHPNAFGTCAELRARIGWPMSRRTPGSARIPTGYFSAIAVVMLN